MPGAQRPAGCVQHQQRSQPPSCSFGLKTNSCCEITFPRDGSYKAKHGTNMRCKEKTLPPYWSALITTRRVHQPSVHPVSTRRPSRCLPRGTGPGHQQAAARRRQLSLRPRSAPASSLANTRSHPFPWDKRSGKCSGRTMAGACRARGWACLRASRVPAGGVWETW